MTKPESWFSTIGRVELRWRGDVADSAFFIPHPPTRQSRSAPVYLVLHKKNFKLAFVFRHLPLLRVGVWLCVDPIQVAICTSASRRCKTLLVVTIMSMPFSQVE